MYTYLILFYIGYVIFYIIARKYDIEFNKPL